MLQRREALKGPGARAHPCTRELQVLSSQLPPPRTKSAAAQVKALTARLLLLWEMSPQDSLPSAAALQGTSNRAPRAPPAHGGAVSHAQLPRPTWMTLPYWITVPSSFLFSVSFCFFSKSAACCVWRRRKRTRHSNGRALPSPAAAVHTMPALSTGQAPGTPKPTGKELVAQSQPVAPGLAGSHGFFNRFLLSERHCVFKGT